MLVVPGIEAVDSVDAVQLKLTHGLVAVSVVQVIVGGPVLVITHCPPSWAELVIPGPVAIIKTTVVCVSWRVCPVYTGLDALGVLLSIVK
jgi:hypothetical protein